MTREETGVLGEEQNLFETALKISFTQNYDNKLFKTLREPTLKLLSHSYFHEAILRFVNVSDIFISDLQPDQHNVGASLFSFLCKLQNVSIYYDEMSIEIVCKGLIH